MTGYSEGVDHSAAGRAGQRGGTWRRTDPQSTAGREKESVQTRSVRLFTLWLLLLLLLFK